MGFNDNISTYAGKDHEVLMINLLQSIELPPTYGFKSALVEVKRMSIQRCLGFPLLNN